MSINCSANDMLNINSDRQNQAERAGHMIYNTINVPSSTNQMSSHTVVQNSSSLSSRAKSMLQWKPETGAMSPVRRTFCLFVTFDLILTFILWVIYTQLLGEGSLWKAFDMQVIKFSIRGSLFDTVMLAAVRFTLLLLFYALLRINHWIIIAISTAITCGYLLTKIFLYDFRADNAGQNPLSYVLVIVSFVLAWVETWFMDFKVLPSEKKYRERDKEQRGRGYSRCCFYLGLVVTTVFFLYALNTLSINRQVTERTNLLDGSQRGYSSADEGGFFTPNDSDDEGTPRRGHSRTGSHSSFSSIVSVRDQEYLTKANHCVDEVFKMLHTESGWKHETGANMEQGKVYSQYFKQYGRKVFKLHAHINYDAKELWEDVVYGVNDSPRWNPTLIECKTIETIDDNTEISYNVAAEAGGGLVSSRDFVIVRRWCVRDGYYVSVGTSVKHPDMPPQRKYVRGENGDGGIIIKSLPNDSSKSEFIWYLNSSLKGWIPQSAVEQGLAGFLTDYLKYLNKRIHSLKQQRNNS